MSRRKKDKTRLAKPQPEPAGSGPEPDPPRPNRPLLVFSIGLTLLWIGVLVVLALFT